MLNLDNFCKGCVHINKLRSIECLECTKNTTPFDNMPHNYSQRYKEKDDGICNNANEH